ncbi:VacJ family lipoprotein [soil metagenome]
MKTSDITFNGAPARQSTSILRWLLSLMLIVGAFALEGCATTASTGPNDTRTAAQRLDPWENWNRKVFAFNESLDKNVLAPVARTYARFVPQMVRKGVSNFFGNFNDAWSAVNNILQWKVTDGTSDVIRVGTNTLFGLGGVMDVASDFGLEKHSEDFGQTLGHWGVGAGAYMVLPVLGPSSVRETAALPLDRAVSPALLIHDGAWQWSLVTLQLINARAGFLGASRLLDDIALDKYTFVRDTYLQRRRSLVYDGDPPDPEESRQPGGGYAPATDTAP